MTCDGASQGVLLGLVVAARPTAQQPSTTLRLAGLSQQVEILRDRWGIAHIYAQNEADLFFAQGYNATRDRLFQFEMWRRQATGTAAEVFGRRELNRDIGARLHMFRGGVTEELNFPIAYSRRKVESVTEERVTLQPAATTESAAAR